MKTILSQYAHHPQVVALSALLNDKTVRALHCSGLQASSAALCFAALAERDEAMHPIVFVLNDEDEAGYFYHDLVQMMGEERVVFYPSSYRRAVKYGQRDAANEILRADVLNRLSTLQEEGAEDGLYVVSYPAALCERVAAPRHLVDNTLRLAQACEYDLTELTTRLRELGFVRRDYVYEPGEYAVRGSILDVYSYSSEYPYRIDFFGDEVESIRSFEVQTQLSKQTCNEVVISPRMQAQAEGEGCTFMAYLPQDAVLAMRDYAFVCETLAKVYEDGFARQAMVEHDALCDEEALHAGSFDKTQVLVPGEVLQQELEVCRRIDLGVRPSQQVQATLTFHIKPQPLFHKNFDLLKQTLQQYLDAYHSIYILADSAKQQERLADILTAQSFTPVLHTLHEGFVDQDLRMCLFTDHQIFDRFHKYSLRSNHARDAKMALSLKEIMQYEPGDYVVHVDHGVGCFAGLVRVAGADGVMQEMIKLVYQHDDVVFVSIHSLHKVSKYRGRDGEPPRLSRLGTGAWEKMKERTKKQIKDIARDLIRLYSRRREEQGFAFSADSFMQQELEASFAYEDTPDQLRVTQEVKADMEQAQPMDRLVCGDVGFGKTEIAVRAAFKAAADNKQVAVLVPTTVLALQHYKTFASRLRDFPVRVEYLSRARTAQQTRRILKELEDGEIQIIVGTHKLIGKNVKFKDLGLLVIDEEQKFGVAVKERLRQLKVNVDTLTMSATPIPRTLQFSLMGARDFSVIQTPPPNRHPIQTEIHTFGHEIIAEAINFEMSRNGQVFIVSNRVSALHNLAELVHKYVPDARVAIGHGQMPPAEMEQVVLDFVNHDADVLISTTIVENGIDIPNANTIIIDAAHHFGLSDLHQMRGRVGRGSRKAFCYLLAPPLSLLKDDARRRLQAIENFSDLGSGIHIAMQDLDIRGAGNLLGAEQSGFIADLGYETYQKILSEAVAELKNEEFATLYKDEAEQQLNAVTGDFFVDDCSVECDLHAYFPEDYVPGSAERMLLYRELDGLESDEQVDAFRVRMVDRFGPLPNEGEELLRIVALRRLGRRLGAERVQLKQGRMMLGFVGNVDSAFYRSATFDSILHFATQNFRRCELREDKGRRRMIVRGVNNVEEAVATMKEMLGEASPS